MAALGRIGLEHVERAQQFSFGKNLSLYWNLRAEGTTAQAQGIKAIAACGCFGLFQGLQLTMWK